MTITIEKIEATTFFCAEARGVSYCARIDTLGRWEVHSHRKALGRSNMGSFRHFETAAEVANTIKAFRDLPFNFSWMPHGEQYGSSLV